MKKIVSRVIIDIEKTDKPPYFKVRPAVITGNGSVTAVFPMYPAYGGKDFEVINYQIVCSTKGKKRG